MYSVVHFTSQDDDSVQLVPSSWVDVQKSNCLWPTGPKLSITAPKLIKTCSAPGESWPSVPANIIKTWGKGKIHLIWVDLALL